MKHATTKPTDEARDEIVGGSGNVFADLNYPDADERQTKLGLAYAIRRIVTQCRLTYGATAALLQLNQPEVSALLHYKLDGFSVERLMTFLTALDRNISR